MPIPQAGRSPRSSASSGSQNGSGTCVCDPHWNRFWEPCQPAFTDPGKWADFCGRLSSIHFLAAVAAVRQFARRKEWHRLDERRLAPARPSRGATDPLRSGRSHVLAELHAGDLFHDHRLRELLQATKGRNRHSAPIAPVPGRLFVEDARRLIRAGRPLDAG